MSRKKTFGVYQIKQANSYVAAHLKNGKYHIDESEMESNLLHAKIQSRHTTNTLYNLWIKYSPATICGWFCQCKCGSRTVGCCAHICSVIWYLEHSRHQCKQVNVKDRLKSSIYDASCETDADDDSD